MHICSLHTVDKFNNSYNYRTHNFNSNVTQYTGIDKNYYYIHHRRISKYTNIHYLKFRYRIRFEKNHKVATSNAINITINGNADE